MNSLFSLMLPMLHKSRTRFCVLIVSVLALTLLTEAASVGAIPSPFFFTENKGQWDSRVLYKCQAKNGMTWFLERDGITLLLTQHGARDSDFGAQSRGGLPRPPDDPVRRTFLSDDVMENNLPEMLRRHPARENVPMKSHALKFKFVKGNGQRAIGNGYDVRDLLRDSRTTRGISSFPIPHCPTPNTLFAVAKSVEANGELPWKNNYFLGNDSTKWAPNCRNFSTVVYREVWDGIDIEWYENDGKLEFDFIVHPGFDPSQIRMSVEGLEDNLSLRGIPSMCSSSESRTPNDSQSGFVTEATKQSHLDNGNREQETGNGENVRALLRDARTTGCTALSLRGMEHRIVSREADSRSEMTKQSQTNEKEDRHVTTDAQGSIVRSSRRQDTTDPLSRTPSPESRVPIAQSPLPIAELLLPTSLGELRTALPSVYQLSANGSRTEIDASFELTDQNTFGMILPNGHNTDHSLRIDPLIYSTFLGGTLGDEAMGVVGDTDGGIIVLGTTTSSNYPTTTGAFDPTHNANRDCFVTRLDSNYTHLVFSTYIGGSGVEYTEGFYGTDSGNILLTGATSSTDFPTTNGAFDQTHNGSYDCYVTSLSRTGDQLVFSTFLGGTDLDAGTAITVDAAGYVFVAGVTLGDFPAPGGVSGSTDCFVVKFNPAGSSLLYSTLLGGVGEEQIWDVISDSVGTCVIVGRTSSFSFPTTNGTYDPLPRIDGRSDGFVLRINTAHAGNSVECGTYLRDTVAGDEVRGVISDGNGGYFIHAQGEQHFPVTPGVFDTTRYGYYIVHMNHAMSELLYSTCFGGCPFGMISDGNGGLIISGQTINPVFLTTQNAFDTTYNGTGHLKGDCFVSHINHDGSELLYSTFLGSTDGDVGKGIHLNSDGSVTVVGYTYSANFPITSNAIDPTFNSSVDSTTDCFITRLRLVPDTSDVVPHRSITPTTFALHQNYPNPFNSSTTISYSLPKPGHVDLRLFDITGREVATLVNQKQQSGSYRVTFDGQQLSSGTYFVRMQAGEFVKTQKMVLLR